MKEIKNLTAKNSCFSEIEHSSLISDMKQKALLLLILMVHKQNGDLKMRGS